MPSCWNCVLAGVNLPLNSVLLHNTSRSFSLFLLKLVEILIDFKCGGDQETSAGKTGGVHNGILHNGKLQVTEQYIKKRFIT